MSPDPRRERGCPMSAGVATYPFSAVVGMEQLRLALLLNAVAPAIGGVLVRGEKGTAKSTVVRALAALLPEVAVVAGCRFACDWERPDPACPDGPHERGAGAAIRAARLVELPIGATEDRLLGSLDLERALTEGVKAYEPGLLAAAHRGVLYVDEANLLHDSLVDLLLDAAAMGRAHVEREGVSVSHAARFLLVGTMNPEEGELRPQLLDRFGLTVEVRASREPAERAQVVRRRLAFEDDAPAFAAAWADDDQALAARIVAARELLPSVQLSDSALRQITAACAAFDVDGLRGDLVAARTALALAAWNGRTEVTDDDVRTAALLALPHRRRRNPFDAPGLDEQQLDDALAPHRSAGGEAGQSSESSPEGPDDDPGSRGPDDDPGGAGPATTRSGGNAAPDAAGDSDVQAGEADAAAQAGDPTAVAKQQSCAPENAAQPAAAGGAPAQPTDPYRVRPFLVPGTGNGVSGRRSRSTGADGRTTGARPADARTADPAKARVLHLPATLRAAAVHQLARGRTGPGLLLRRSDLRVPVRQGREANLVLFAVDASGSMAARARMAAVKGAVLSLLLDAYQRRDKVGLITFRGHNAELALPPTSSVESGAARLSALPTGGRTPLAAGLLRAAEVLRLERLRDPQRRPLLVVVTDGRHTSGPDPASAAGLLAAAGVASVVVDCEDGVVRLGLAPRLAAQLRGEVVRLEELAADSLAGIVRDARRAA